MSLKSLMRKAGNVAGTASRVVSRIPGGSAALRIAGRALPVVSTVLAAKEGFDLLRGGGGGGAPAPMLPPGMGGPGPSPAGGGIIPFFRGPGGKLQLPWNDPAQMLQPPFAYDDSYLRQYVKAPPGYVVVTDPKGRKYAMLRSVAITLKLWKPARKPFLTASDMHHISAVSSVVNKFKTVEKRIKKIANFRSPQRHSDGGRKGKGK